jgi:hypothetical protein
MNCPRCNDAELVEPAQPPKTMPLPFSVTMEKSL